MECCWAFCCGSNSCSGHSSLLLSGSSHRTFPGTHWVHCRGKTEAELHINREEREEVPHQTISLAAWTPLYSLSCFSIRGACTQILGPVTRLQRLLLRKGNLCCDQTQDWAWLSWCLPLLEARLGSRKCWWQKGRWGGCLAMIWKCRSEWQ